MQVHFYKYQGAGNDFILLDQRNTSLTFSSHSEVVRKLCDRRFGIGADGLMLLQNREGYDFEMVYYNADGAIGSMCGNGGRCIVAFAKALGIISAQTKFLASDGEHTAYFENDLVALQMIEVTEIQTQNENSYFLNTGSPHVVEFVNEISHYDVFNQGKQIRYSEAFAPNGTNVNFVTVQNETLHVRTYERGVEDETWACGTGATAAALAYAFKNQNYGQQTIPIQVLGGELRIEFQFDAPSTFSHVYLIGPAVKVFEGSVEI